MSTNYSKRKTMFWTKVIFVLCAICTYCEPASIGNNKKCGFVDEDCQKELYRSILEEIADSGIPDLGIPAIDRFEIKDKEIVALGLIKVAMPDGVAKGFKSCRSTNFHINADTLTHSIEFVCERFQIDGKYNIQTTPALEALIGGIKIHGDGKASVDLENVQISLEIPFEIKKLEDSEPHVVMDADKITYTYKVLGKATFSADNLHIGSQDISDVAINIFNENWQFITNSFARPIIDTGVEIFVEYANKFFEKYPITEFIEGDISAYITN